MKERRVRDYCGVCLDCCDFIKSKIDCEMCGVHKLKLLELCQRKKEKDKRQSLKIKKGR